MQESIGIIAGGGQFPRIVAENIRAAGHGVVICGFTGHTDDATLACADASVMLPGLRTSDGRDGAAGDKDRIHRAFQDL